MADESVDAGDRGSEEVEACVDVFVAAVDLLDVAYCACTFGRHGGEKQGYAGTDVG